MLRLTVGLLGALALASVAAPAAATGPAAPSRIWVSGHGVDQAGCGAPASPCRSLQFAHDAIAAGGEIDILDPAGYGSVTISKSLSIVNDGVGTAGVQASSGNAITINAGAGGQVYLRGLNIDGLQEAATNGVVFNTGARLTLANCVVRRFQQSGILLAPAAATVLFDIAGVVTSDNGNHGLFFQPSGTVTVNGLIDRLTADGNTIGVDLDASAQTVGASNLVLANLVAANNSSIGVRVFTGTTPNLTVTVDNADISLNFGDGLDDFAAAVVHLNRSTVDQNGGNGITASPVTTGQILTTGNNEVTGNAGNNVAGSVFTQGLR